MTDEKPPLSSLALCVSAMLSAISLVVPILAHASESLQLVRGMDDPVCRKIEHQLSGYRDHQYSKNGELSRGTIESAAMFGNIKWKPIPLRTGERLWQPDVANGPFVAIQKIFVGDRSYTAIKRSSAFNGAFRSEWIELYPSDRTFEEYDPQVLSRFQVIAIGGAPGDALSEHVLTGIAVKFVAHPRNRRDAHGNPVISADFSNLVLVDGEVLVTFRSHEYLDVEKPSGRVFVENRARQWWRVFARLKQSLYSASIGSPIKAYLDDACYFTRNR